MITDRQIRHERIKEYILDVLRYLRKKASAEEISWLSIGTKYYLPKLSVNNYLIELFKEGKVKREKIRQGKRKFYVYYISE